jgi:2-polyprenyl-3-methyl-5-hydroxy-6-metoxy-1,4-benzoquinol methylase
VLLKIRLVADSNPNGEHTYKNWAASQNQTFGAERGPEMAIGGEFYAFGVVEREMLRFYGLTHDKYVIDVGCGSGRLSQALARSHKGRYLGIDIVPDLVQHAKLQTNRPDWRFETVENIAIPEIDGAADIVCMFSVLTHLLHEQSYLYLEEAKRVSRPGGTIVISFLEFAMASHWAVFESTLQTRRAEGEAPLNVFIERNVFECWAAHLGLVVKEFRRGDEPFVPLTEVLTLDSGALMKDLGYLGQSICVLTKP